MRPGQRFKNFYSAIGKFYMDMSSIHGAGFPQDEILERQTIYQLDCGVVGSTQTFASTTNLQHCPPEYSSRRSATLHKPSLSVDGEPRHRFLYSVEAVARTRSR